MINDPLMCVVCGTSEVVAFGPYREEDSPLCPRCAKDLGILGTQEAFQEIAPAEGFVEEEWVCSECGDDVDSCGFHLSGKGCREDSEE